MIIYIITSGGFFIDATSSFDEAEKIREGLYMNGYNHVMVTPKEV